LAVSLQFNDTHQALALDPNYTKARQYLGEAFLQKGDVVKAKEQLMEIADRCGGPCDDYELLVKAIAAHVTGQPRQSPCSRCRLSQASQGKSCIRAIALLASDGR
jgi:hypothetical protein